MLSLGKIAGRQPQGVRSTAEDYRTREWLGKGTMLALFADRPVESFMPKASSSCVMSSMTLIMPTHTMAGR
jgi:hypothetical protein